MAAHRATSRHMPCQERHPSRAATASLLAQHSLSGSSSIGIEVWQINQGSKCRSSPNIAHQTMALTIYVQAYYDVAHTHVQ